MWAHSCGAIHVGRFVVLSLLGTCREDLGKSQGTSSVNIHPDLPPVSLFLIRASAFRKDTEGQPGELHPSTAVGGE